MKTQISAQFIKKILLVIISFSFIACASKPQPAAEIYSNEPIVIDQSQYNAPPSSDPTIDDSMSSHSSGIAAPAEDTGFVEPPVETMNGVEPPAHSLANQDAMEAALGSEAAMEEPMMTESTSTSNLNEIPADYFTVQVVASSTMKNLNAFATQYGFSTKLTTQVTVADKTWNVLLVGSYPTLEKAKEALAGIKANVPTSPWIRKVSTLQ